MPVPFISFFGSRAFSFVIAAPEDTSSSLISPAEHSLPGHPQRLLDAVFIKAFGFKKGHKSYLEVSL